MTRQKINECFERRCIMPFEIKNGSNEDFRTATNLEGFNPLATVRVISIISGIQFHVCVFAFSLHTTTHVMYKINCDEE